jgi:hypothetical protein
MKFLSNKMAVAAGFALSLGLGYASNVDAQQMRSDEKPTPNPNPSPIPAPAKASGIATSSVPLNPRDFTAAWVIDGDDIRFCYTQIGSTGPTCTKAVKN